MIYFTSDQHYYHSKIIEYCQRPFTSTMEMQTVLIKNYNHLIRPDDLVYFVGDLTLTPFTDQIWHLLAKLPGKKILIKGNHDKLSRKKYIEAGFIDVKYYDCVEGFMVVHNPADNYFDLPCICGHVHNRWIRKGNNINVSVDVWDFKPISLNFLKKKYKSPS